eukprot:21010-Alexandrium_andersonii.AAC.1
MGACAYACRACVRKCSGVWCTRALACARVWTACWRPACVPACLAACLCLCPLCGCVCVFVESWASRAIIYLSGLTDAARSGEREVGQNKQ